MKAYLPNPQIALAIGRTLLSGQSRRAYVALACVNGLIIFGGGFAMGGSLRSFLQVAGGLIVVILQYLWIWFALKLLALNHPTAARLVPHYVQRLRVTALWIWASIVVATGLLDGANGGEVLWAAVASAGAMILLSTPFRWPVRWCIFVFLAIPFLLKRAPEMPEEFFAFLKVWSSVLGLACIGFGAVIVLNLFHPHGSNYAKTFARVSAGGGALPKGVRAAEPKLAEFGVWGLRAVQLGQWFTLPFAIYSQWLQRHGATGTRHFLARIELSVGSTPHWVTQIQIVLVLLLGLGFAPMTAVAQFADFIAGTLLMIELFRSRNMPEIFRKTTMEQKLLLMLPGMPQGNALTQHLARRHLVQAYVSWSVAAAIALWLLPLEGNKWLIAVSAYLATLILIPLTPTINWAKLGPLRAQNGLLALANFAAVGGSIFAVQRWGHVQAAALFAAAVCCSLALLNWRWNQLKCYPQAFPVGQWLTMETQS